MKARDNPFSTDRILRVRFRPQGVPWEGLLARLESMNGRGAIVGLHGSGKTTMLEDLAERLEGAGTPTLFIRLDMIEPRLSLGRLMSIMGQLARETVLLIDGADILPAWQWLLIKWRSRRAGGLVVTSHGKRLLPTLHHTVTSPALLREVVAEVITPQPLPAAADIDRLYATHQGNLRDALRGLYDQYAERD